MLTRDTPRGCVKNSFRQPDSCAVRHHVNLCELHGVCVFLGGVGGWNIACIQRLHSTGAELKKFVLQSSCDSPLF
jgi:hypothetical protein